MPRTKPPYPVANKELQTSMDIFYTTGQSQLGQILLAASESGVISVLLADDRDSLKSQLESQLQIELSSLCRDHFKVNRIIRDDLLLADYTKQMTDFLECPKTMPDIPLHYVGSPFQIKVWQLLREIPIGKTMTYSEIAEKLGQSSMARVVARACATNHIAVLIPCHRVIRQDGNMAGYRWGINKKIALLKKEACHATTPHSSHQLELLVT